MKRYISSLVALSFTLMAPLASAQTSDPQINALLGKVAAAYKDMSAFSATIETTQSSGATERKVTTKLTLQKPDKLVAEIQSGEQVTHVVADGKTIYSDSSRDKTTYTEQPVEKFDSLVTALARGGGSGVGLLPILLSGVSLEARIIPGKPSSVTHQADETIDGTPCDVIVAIIGNGNVGSRMTFAFGKEDHLLRRLTMGSATAAKPSAVETYSSATLQPVLTDAMFKYTPAPGAVATAAPKEPDRFDPRLKVGADPLPLKGKDLAGQAVSLDQYKGKVVLVDFWAIWCGPCIAELPNVVAAYDKYHGQGFEIVGISLDQANARPKLEAFIAEHKMPWRQVYDGGYWQAENAVAWGVKAIPFTVLIGRDGKIAAVGARGPDLAPAIEAALKKP